MADISRYVLFILTSSTNFQDYDEKRLQNPSDVDLTNAGFTNFGRYFGLFSV